MHGGGSPTNLLEMLKDAFKQDNCDLIIFGHSHKPMNERIGHTLFFNPGSATDVTVAYNSYGLIELREKPANSANSSAENSQIEARIIKI